MGIKEAIIALGILCEYAACCSVTEYICRDTTPEAVDAVLKSIGVYPDYRAFWSGESKSDSNGVVYINKMYANGKSWD